MTPPFPPFPLHRPRRLRKADYMRDLVEENSISTKDLIWPIFIKEGDNLREDVDSLPGVERLSIDLAIEAANEAANMEIPVVALFPYTDPSLKTPDAAEAANPDNLVNRATRAIKHAVPDIAVMLDVALDPYNSDGHDGIVRDGEIINDETLMVLEQQALTHAEAGADILGPSDMMDGRIGLIRQSLEQNEFSDVSILSYSAKFASNFYGPFRDAVGSSGTMLGDKKTYQINPANMNEALNMVARDLAEGADMVMVKPGMPYLDVCHAVSNAFRVPVFAYQVSGEYAMIKAAAQNGWIDGERAMMEAMMGFKRAGCSGVLTYFAPEIATRLQKG